MIYSMSLTSLLQVELVVGLRFLTRAQADAFAVEMECCAAAQWVQAVNASAVALAVGMVSLSSNK